MCTPLGACLAFKGIQGAITLLHGSQGCATYIRRYMISHYKEPVDIASSNFSEQTAVFGGGSNLIKALENVTKQYNPVLIGVASTCLSETIGEDMAGIIRGYCERHPEAPVIVPVSTASYQGTHADGYWKALRAVVEQLVVKTPTQEIKRQINVFPGICSPADIRYLKEIAGDFRLPFVLLPDYSETLDGPAWTDYQRLPSGGTTVTEITSTGQSQNTLQFGKTANEHPYSPGEYLWEKFGIPVYKLGLPIGVAATDYLFRLLPLLSGNAVPDKYRQERGRLIDAYVDGHKYVSQKKAIVYGEKDLVIALDLFLKEIGVNVVLAAYGDETDFETIAEQARELKPDFFIGNSKGYRIARELDVPLVRVGFPIHDRFGAQRLLHYGYRGTQELFDRIVNALLDKKQDDSDMGYSYL
jgi:nitrogenase molybdenum-iron protein NifN